MRNIICVKNISKSFFMRKGVFGPELQKIKAVDEVSFSIIKGECFGLVGESGCGKTTTARIVMGLLTADKGEIFFNNTLVIKKNMNLFRKKMQIVFQDPFSSLNPRWRVRDIIAEGFFKKGSAKEEDRETERLLETVGLDKRDKNKYPHQFSGGQRQRIGIARALASKPEFIVLDEPVSSLDVSVQAQILNLLGELKEKFELTYLFIAHDLAVVEYFCDKVAVMKEGKIVEEGHSREIFSAPKHHYTKLLLSSILPLKPLT